MAKPNATDYPCGKPEIISKQTARGGSVLMDPARRADWSACDESWGRVSGDASVHASLLNRDRGALS